MTGKPRWDPQAPGAEALWRGEKGDKGEPGMTPGARRAVVFLFAFGILIAAISLIYTTRIADHLRTEVQSQCRFDADLAGVPVAVNPATRKASLIGVKIVSDSRVAWHQAGCPGRLASPSPSFVKWARYYRLPAG